MMVRTFLLSIIIPFSVNAADVSQFFKGNGNDIQKIIGYKGGSVEGADLPLEQAESTGSARREASAVFNTKATLDRETKLEEAGYTRDKEGFAADNKGFIDKARQAMKDAENAFSGGYAECVSEEQTITREKEETCEEFYDVKHKSCFARQLVEIDPKYTYRCSKKREVKEKACEDKLKSIQCKQAAECDSGGIVLKSLASDMKWAYSYPYLVVGTITDNEWRDRCGKFVKNTQFEVKNKSLIEEFRIVEVGYDDYLRITINGIQVYNGPFGGEKLEIKSRGRFRSVDTGSGGIHGCELNTNRHANISVDLIPYLKEGMNDLLIEVVVAGAGEGWAKIKTKQHCCTEWVEEREEVCNFL